MNKMGFCNGPSCVNPFRAISLYLHPFPSFLVRLTCRFPVPVCNFKLRAARLISRRHTPRAQAASGQTVEAGREYGGRRVLRGPLGIRKTEKVVRPRRSRTSANSRSCYHAPCELGNQPYRTRPHWAKASHRTVQGIVADHGIRPGTMRTLRGAAIQTAAAEMEHRRIASTKAGL